MEYVSYRMGEHSENCYCVSAGQECILIDPGSDDEKHITGIKEIIGKKKLLAIIYTHNHYDHIRGGHCFDVPQYMHQEDIKSMKLFNKKFGEKNIIFPKVSALDTKISFGAIKAKVVHTPGHSRGSVCFDFGEFLCTGDTLFHQAHGRTNIPYADEKKIFESISILLSYPDFMPILPGHGKESTIGMERIWMDVLAR